MIRNGIKRTAGMPHKLYMKYLFGADAEEVEKNFDQVIIQAWNKEREKIGKTMNQNNAKSNGISGVKSCFRRERPESSYLSVSRILGYFFAILLLPLALLITVFAHSYGFILRMTRKFTGKNSAKIN